MVKTVQSIPLASLRAARNRIAGNAIRTPLVRLELADAPAEIYLKLENLQPIGSFKIRGSANAMGLLARDQLDEGVCTASAGNMAQGVAWNARRRGISCRVIVPESAPRIKLEAVEEMGAEVIPVPFDEWWRAMEEYGHPDVPGYFIHPVCDPAVIAGNGTIGFEILEDLPDVDTVIVPFGGGGLSCGIASALRFLRPEVLVHACEVETAAPLAAALEAGEPVEIEHTPSFVDGIGGKCVLPAMWPLAERLIADSLVVSVADVADAVGLLLTHARVVTEGAGAASVAAAVAGLAEGEKIVCVVSGGNIDTDKLIALLDGEIPGPG